MGKLFDEEHNLTDAEKVLVNNLEGINSGNGGSFGGGNSGSTGKGNSTGGRGPGGGKPAEKLD